MKIGIVSDTHSHALPRQLIDDFKKVDLIIHAGDFCTATDLHVLKDIAEVKGVSGNMDGSDIRKIFPEKAIFDIEGLSVGVIHGFGSPDKVPANVREKFKKNKVHIVVFGHSHHPYKETIDGVLYFNPGSPNDIVRAPYCSYGLMDINHGQVTAKIVKVK